MPLSTSDMPGPEFVEQATSAPGEKRRHVHVIGERCEELVQAADGHMHPCDREAGHKGKHSYRANE